MKNNFNKLNLFCILTNVLYLAAGIVALTDHTDKKTVWGVLLLILTVISSIYHINGKLMKMFLIPDIIISCIILGYGIYLFSEQDPKDYWIVVCTLLMLLVLVITKFYPKLYKYIHPLAHVFGGTACILLSTN